MDTNSTGSSRGAEFFFSDTFLMQLRIDEDNGSIEGRIAHYPIGFNLVESFRGICTKDNGLIKFSFFIEWSNPNLNNKVLTAYSGEIFRSSAEEVNLTLEWLQVLEGRPGLGVQAYKGCEVLRGFPGDDQIRRPARLALLQRLEEPRKGF